MAFCLKVFALANLERMLQMRLPLAAESWPTTSTICITSLPTPTGQLDNMVVKKPCTKQFFLRFPALS